MAHGVTRRNKNDAAASAAYKRAHEAAVAAAASRAPAKAPLGPADQTTANWFPDYLKAGNGVAPIKTRSVTSMAKSVSGGSSGSETPLSSAGEEGVTADLAVAGAGADAAQSGRGGLVAPVAQSAGTMQRVAV